MNQGRARRERQERRREYEIRLRNWEAERPPWWAFWLRRKWKASKPQYVRR